VRRAIDALQAHQGPILAEALVHHADLAWAENDLRETARLAEEALGAAKRYQAPSVEVQALTLLGAASVRLGKDEGLEHLAEAARRCAEQSVALARAGTIAASAARVSLAHVMSDQGEGEAALALFDSVREDSERNEPDRRVIYWSYRAQALLGLDRLDEAWES